MKYVRKGSEPNTLKIYRETTPNATYDGFVDTDKKLKKALAKEQKYICAYCMGRVDVDSITVEHYISQKKHIDSKLSENTHKRNALLFKNMIGVCVNQGEHCDKHRGNKPIRCLNPLDSKCEKHIMYSFSGEILCKGGNVNVSYDINDLFNLNCSKLKKLRNAALEEAKKKFQDANSKGTWTKKLISAELLKYKEGMLKRSKLKHYEYCGYIVWYFQELLKCPKYK